MTAFLSRWRKGVSGLDPRTKIVACAILLLEAIVAKGVVALGLVAFLSVSAAFLSPVSRRRMRSLARGAFPLLACIMVFDCLGVQGGSVVLSLGFASVTERGLMLAAETAVRFFSALLAGMALMASTKPLDLSEGVRLLANPLSRIGVPVEDGMLALAITLRFVPVLQQELLRIMEAQAERMPSVRASSRRITLRNVVPLTMPLLSSAIRRAESLALAMTNRSYARGAKRTSLREYRMRAADWAVLALAALSLLAVVIS